MKTHLIYLSIIVLLVWLNIDQLKNTPPELSFVIKQVFQAEKIKIKYLKGEIDYIEIDRPIISYNSFFNQKKVADNKLGIILMQDKIGVDHNFILKNLYLGYFFNFNSNLVVNSSNLYIRLEYVY